jgi:DNA helicase II / ATP-dependent DNA helicase PcrA
VLAEQRLNPSQIAAIEHKNGPLVVFAGAGSGKTMVITHRVAHLVTVHGVPPWRILAVTFTNKAAAVMRERLSKLLKEGADDLWVGTFHAICARLLRRYSEDCGVRRDFVIYDDLDQKAVLKRLIAQENLDDQRYTPKLLAWYINRTKQEGVGSQESESKKGSDAVLKQVYVAYEAQLKKAGALDFGDLIYQLVRAMHGNEKLREELRRRFDHVLVDEFQDTNRVQFQFVQQLCEGHRNVCVVGDDDQSIYRWRGADRRNILDFNRRFTDAKLVKLEQNYRSTKRILRVANAVISCNVDRQSKTLWTENTEGQSVTLATCADERYEAQFFITTVKELVANGRRRSDIALLYRVHAQSRVFEEALRAANLPYRVFGGLRFYDRAEVKDLLAYLRVLHNPDDDVSLLRIINTPARGIGKTTIDRVLDVAAKAGSSVWQIVCNAAEATNLGPAGQKKFGGFLELMRSLKEMADNGVGPARLADAILEKTGYLTLLKNEDKAEADAKIENIKELVGSIRDYERLEENPSLASFLELVTLQTDVDKMVDDDSVTLMTIHAAKGLEFPAVMVAGLEEGMFPHFSQDADDDEEDQIEEERRLAYVAFTRARERLFLSSVLTRNIYGESRMCERSRFIREIPANELHRVSVLQKTPMTHSVQNRGAQAGYSLFSKATHSNTPGKKVLKGDSYVDRSENSDLDSAFYQGMQVRHNTFGLGRVDSVCPGNPQSVIVVFKTHGRKTIRASYLEPI